MAFIRKILVVDDDAQIRETLAMLLEKRGYSVTTAESAIAARGTLEGASFDLIFSDVNMPRMSGFELLQEVRRAGATPVVLMSGNPEVSLQDAISKGASGFMLKPFDFKVVDSVLEDCFGGEALENMTHRDKIS